MQRTIEFDLVDSHKAFEIADSLVSNSFTELPPLFHCKHAPQSNCCLTHKIGLPYHPALRRHLELTDYQLELFEKVQKLPNAKYIINKGRQMGITEIVLRIIHYQTLQGKYVNGKVGIIAGTNADLARKNLRRLYGMYKNLGVVKDAYFRGHVIELQNGSVIEAFRANEESLTGDTNYRAIFIDESAKWRLRDDSPVFNSIMPIIETNKADLFLVSTPKGPIKKFFEIWQDKESDFIKMELPIWKAENQLYSTQEIQDMLSNSVEDTNQEYLCQFTVGRNSIFAGYENHGGHEEIIL